MNSKQSLWKLILGAACVGLLVTNCTLKTDSDKGEEETGCTPGKKKSGCTCPGATTGYQLCEDDGTYAACTCPTGNEGGGSNAGGPSSSAGASYTAGYGGMTAVAGAPPDGEGGEAGAGVSPISTDCGTCLTQLCAPEFAACEADNETTVVTPGDDYCLGQGVNAAPGQFELIQDCITAERAKGPVKRDAVRACGSTIGASADPQSSVWAPPEMTPATENLMNCLADATDETNPGAWATDASNFPQGMPRPWDDGTCAKIACTSKLP